MRKPDAYSDSIVRGGSRTAATSKMERFVIIINDFQPLTIITKCSILVVAAVLDPPLIVLFNSNSLKKCQSIFKARQMQNLMYSDVKLPVSIESAMGYQKICSPFESTMWKNGKSRKTRRTTL